MIIPLTTQEKLRIKNGCAKELWTCYENMCPYLNGNCTLLEGEYANRPYDEKWTGNNLYKDEKGNLFIKTNMKVTASFPTSKEVKKREKEIAKNFIESW